MSNALLLIVLYAFNYIDIVSSQNRTHYEGILNRIFTTNKYNKKVLPSDDYSNPVALDASLFFMGINEINELEEKFVTTGYLFLNWYDSMFTWDLNDFGGITKIFVPQDDVWKPDIVLKNGFKRFREMGGSFYNVEIDATGFVYWLPFEVFETRCAIDTSNYPFDKQSCDIIFVVWSHQVQQVEILRTAHGIVIDEEFQENSVWKIDSTSTTVRKETRESTVVFTFKMTRKPLYYIINIILPIVFLGLLNGLVFIIPAESGEKTGYSITVFLSLAVFLTIISSQLPSNSENVSILGVYLLLQVVFGVVVLFVTTLQLRMSHRKGAVPKNGYYVKITRFSKKMRCALSNRGKVEDSDNAEKAREEAWQSDDSIEWGDVASALDCIFFWIFLILYIFTTASTFGWMALDHGNA